MALLHTSKRCRLFEKISSDVWRLLVRNHRTSTQAYETGITNNTIIPEIRDNALSNPNIGVWANNSFKEIEHGSDIDIFVETIPGVYIWWALQAKVLKLNGRYEGVSKLHNGEYQWDKLKRLSSISGCLSRYLLFNGVADFSCFEQDACERYFDQEQLGCSLVKIADFSSKAINGNPYFSDFHPKLAEPWRIITCCKNSISGEKVTLYRASQIKKAINYYPNSNKTADFITEFNTDKSMNKFSDDYIKNVSMELNRVPEYRIVVRSTESLDLENP